jgi:hypothetical protein
MSEHTTLFCDACGLPIGPKPAPVVYEHHVSSSAEFMSAVFGMRRQAAYPEAAEYPPAPEGQAVRVVAPHMHDSCREALQGVVDICVRELREQVSDSTELLRSVFEGPLA